MRSPSEKLLNLLTSSGLCHRAELDLCEPLVRRLSQDLPDFDSVWLDALVERKLLTPWQADQILADDVEKIVVGRYLCKEPLGIATFLASDSRHKSQVILRSLKSHDSRTGPWSESRTADLLTSIDRCRSSAPAGLALPTELIVQNPSDSANATGSESASAVFLVSPYIRGWSMEELLIRGGRLPWPVVAEIGRELLTVLAWLESVRLLHGDLVARNVRMDPTGRIHLVDPFVRRFLQPQFALSDRLTLRDCDGVAPEQVGTGRLADARSELYALGCLLWHLLTSRPVVLSADPVTRVMKQKDHDIIDVRGPVPDCPEWMSRIIVSLTRRSPELRPAGAVEVLKAWRSHSGGGLRQCRAIARSMPDHSLRSRTRPVVRRRTRSGSWRWPVTASAVLGVLVFLTARSGVLPKTLRLGLRPETSVVSMETAKRPSGQGEAVMPEAGPSMLPKVDAEGVIRLESGKQYLAAPCQFPGTLRILCEQSPVAEIIVPENARWQLRARSVELRGVSVSRQADSVEALTSRPDQKRFRQLLEIQSASLTIEGCIIQSPAQSDDFEGLAWLKLAEAEGVVLVRNSVFAGGGYGLSMNHPPRRFELQNVLLANRGSGVLCEFQQGDSTSWSVTARNVTQRFGYSLLDAMVHDNGIRSLELNLASSESVYSPQMAILRLRIPDAWSPDAIRVQLQAGESGNPAIVPPTVTPVVYIDPRLRQPVSLPDSQLTDNSVLLAELVFDEQSASNDDANNVASGWSSSALLDFEGPKMTLVMPGIDVGQLPQR
jgi:eukaryotic-like serine/threonine-protein kinase